MTLDRRSFLATSLAVGFTAGQARAQDILRVAVISDLNGSYGSTDYGPEIHEAVARIIALAPNLVICTGDMVAGQRAKPKLSDDELAAMWAGFHAAVTDPFRAAGIPMLVTPGNHDASGYPGYEREREVYDSEWTRRSPDVEILDGERYPFRYAVSHGGALFIGLDATQSGAQPIEEQEWLAQLLREEAGRHRATVVFGHLPIWPVTQGRETDIIGDAAFQELLASGGVGVYLSGHHHGYFPARAGGLLQIVQACLGDGPRKYIGTETRAEKGFTLLEISAAGAISAKTFAAPLFDKPIDEAALPAVIVSKAARLEKADPAS